MQLLPALINTTHFKNQDIYSPYGCVCTSGIFREDFLQLHDSWVNFIYVLGH